MKTNQKLFSLVLLLALMLSFAAPVHAFDGRGGDNVVIKAGEVIDDDLYIGAQTITFDGTVTGDFVAGAQTVIINGTVEGDLIVGAQTVVINGSVGDDARALPRRSSWVRRPASAGTWWRWAPAWRSSMAARSPTIL